MALSLRIIFPIFVPFLVALSVAAEPFHIGANLIDWECMGENCYYGRDIGTNGWTELNLKSKGWDGSARFRRANWAKMMSDLSSANASLVRIPLMTEGQGILWKRSAFSKISSEREEIRGVDPFWLKNVQTLLDLAKSHGLKVELGLLTGNTPRSKEGHRNFYYGKEIILTNPRVQQQYLKHVLRPFVSAIRRHPALYSIEVMGEADGVSHEHGNISDAQIRDFIAASVKTIRAIDSKILITASTGYARKTPQSVEELFAGLGLNYYEVHLYSNDARIRDCSKWRTLQAPVLIGEFGLSEPLGTAFETEKAQAKFMKEFIGEAKKCGFMGALFWAMDLGPSGTDETKRFQNLYTQRGNTKSQVLQSLKDAIKLAQ